VLYEIAVEIQRAHEIEQLAELARDRFKWLLDFDAGSLVLRIPPDGERHVALASSGDARDLAAEALEAGHPVRRRAPGSDAIALPIEQGALAFERSRPLDPEDFLIVRLLAVFFGAAVERALHLREVRRLAEQVRDASRQREQLLRMVVHDLRNPLAGLQGALALLADSAPADPADGAVLALAAAGANNLESLVESLFGVVQFESGGFEPRLAEVSVVDLISGVVERHRPQARLERIELTSDLAAAPARWTLDADWIGRTLENLLLNAIRYAPAGSTVAVTADACEDGRRLRVAVADQGPGIPAEDRERIFDAGVRLGDPGRATRRGVGLGLAFCRLAVERHGGRIAVADRPATGACVIFELPAAPAAAGAHGG
jgi:signal transduction histidine kinase